MPTKDKILIPQEWCSQLIKDREYADFWEPILKELNGLSDAAFTAVDAAMVHRTGCLASCVLESQEHPRVWAVKAFQLIREWDFVWINFNDAVERLENAEHIVPELISTEKKARVKSRLQDLNSFSLSLKELRALRTEVDLLREESCRKESFAPIFKCKKALIFIGEHHWYLSELRAWEKAETEKAQAEEAARLQAKAEEAKAKAAKAQAEEASRRMEVDAFLKAKAEEAKAKAEEAKAKAAREQAEEASRLKTKAEAAFWVKREREETRAKAEEAAEAQAKAKKWAEAQAKAEKAQAEEAQQASRLKAKAAADALDEKNTIQRTKYLWAFFIIFLIIPSFFVAVNYVVSDKRGEAEAAAKRVAVEAEAKRVVVAKVQAETDNEERRRLKAGELSAVEGVGLVLVPIAGGTFSMGSMSDGSSEQRVTTVTLSPFWLARTEVTQAQWEAVMGSNPSHFKGGQLPVQQVSWGDAMEFCRKLTERELQAGHLPTGTIYTLPTEAQWEYACRAGTTGDYAGDLDAMAWYNKNSGRVIHMVGAKQSNAWGLHDMHGNVWEWCLDWYGPYSGGHVTDPKGVPSGTARVLRGGSFGDVAGKARSVYRNSYSPDIWFPSYGFRPARSSVP